MKHKNRLKKLAKRRELFDKLKSGGSDRGGRTIYTQTQGGKYQAFHRPGSNKK